MMALQGEWATLLVSWSSTNSKAKLTNNPVELNQLGENANRTSATTLKMVPMIMKGRRRPMRNVAWSETAPTSGLTAKATSVPQMTTIARLMSLLASPRNLTTMLGMTMASSACQWKWLANQKTL